MTLGPVHMVVIGFEGNRFTGEILKELDSLREHKIIRLLDYLFVSKDEEGDTVALKGTDLNRDEAIEFGAIIGGLLGLGMAGEAGMEAGMVAGAEMVAEHDFGFTEEEIRRIASDLPKNSSAAFILFEHLWAVQLKEKMINAGGRMLVQGLIEPRTLVEMGAAMAASRSDT